jgi:hypothetical protein
VGRPFLRLSRPGEPSRWFGTGRCCYPICYPGPYRSQPRIERQTRQIHLLAVPAGAGGASAPLRQGALDLTERQPLKHRSVAARESTDRRTAGDCPALRRPGSSVAVQVLDHPFAQRFHECGQAVGGSRSDSASRFLMQAPFQSELCAPWTRRSRMASASAVGAGTRRLTVEPTRRFPWSSATERVRRSRGRWRITDRTGSRSRSCFSTPSTASHGRSARTAASPPPSGRRGSRRTPRSGRRSDPSAIRIPP